MADAFCVSRATVQRVRRRFVAESEAAFLKRRQRLWAVGVHTGVGRERDGVVGRDIVKASRRKMPTHCRAGDLGEAGQLDALPARERLLLGVIRMIACRAETRMMLPVMRAQGHKPHPRKLPQALLTADADVLPAPANGVLRVHILGLANDACDRQIDVVLSDLNATETVFPGTGLRLVYDVDGAPESTQPVSAQISRGQEV